MNTKNILAVLAGAVVTFLLGWLLFGVLLMDFYSANTTHYEGLMKEMPDLIFIFLSNLVWSLLYVIIFVRWAGIKSFSGGFVAGLIIGLPMMISFDLYFVAGMNLFTTTGVVVDVIANTFVSGVLGGVIGWILGYKQKAA